MASNAKFCSQCASPLTEPNPPFCSECGASANVESPSIPAADLTPNGVRPKMVSFPKAIKLGFQNYFNFRSRATRAEFWWWWLFGFITNSLAEAGDIAMSPLIEWWILWDTTLPGYGILSVVFEITLFIPSIAVLCRRLHDTNRSGWLLIAPLVTFVISLLLVISNSLIIIYFIPATLGLIIWIVVLCVKRGTVGPNEYGPDPRNPN